MSHENPLLPTGAYSSGTPKPTTDKVPGLATEIPLSHEARKPQTKLTTPPVLEPKDSFREIIETVVFVVVLVVMFKILLAEAFVIPTGSMATTLLGYHHKVVCNQCSYPFTVNASSEVDPPNGRDPVFVTGCTCPNCGAPNEISGQRGIR